MDEYRMINGRDLSSFVSGFLSFIKKVFIYILTSLKNSFIIAILIFLLMLAIGLFCRYKAGVYYEAVMVCTFREMNKKTYGEMVHSLDMLTKSHSYDALATKLHIPLQDAQRIISIEGKNMAGSMLYEDITPDKSPIYFYVKTTTNTVYPVLQPALLSYVNNESPYMNGKFQTDSVTIYTQVQNLTNNIALVDSAIVTRYVALKRAVSAADALIAYARKGPNTNTTLIDSITATKYALLKGAAIVDTSINTSRSDSLIKYKSDLQAQLLTQEQVAKDLKRPVEVLHGFAPSDEPVNDKNKILRISIIAGLLLSCAGAVVSNALRSGKNLRTI